MCVRTEYVLCLLDQSVGLLSHLGYTGNCISQHPLLCMTLARVGQNWSCIRCGRQQGSSSHPALTATIGWSWWGGGHKNVGWPLCVLTLPCSLLLACWPTATPRPLSDVLLHTHSGSIYKNQHPSEDAVWMSPCQQPAPPRFLQAPHCSPALGLVSDYSMRLQHLLSDIQIFTPPTPPTVV